ncbi:4'-phosphopantetheinyl transferase family protein [Bacillus cereus]|uniref:4'-phosphopantetheinyl transferase family protein n=1 Tax=Bacillus cereus TaxID=1396 RepID=UPI0010BEF377|nr:4'-phosphopantetheinyl transferase superfamily protein [Bacillus cereus]TKH96149.1 4'-phosphopantetheinyl transferase superfamily protein [Bacillus cereus]
MTKMISVYAIKKPRVIDENRYNILIKIVSADKRRKIESYVNKEDSYRSLLGDVLIRSIICKKYKVLNQNIEYEYNKYGKPYWKGKSDFFFNISHSGDWIVGITDNAPVGIDVEEIHNIKLDFVSQFFSAMEVKNLNAKPYTERINHFYDIWTLKESYIKALGKGLSIPLDSFTIKKNSKEDIIVEQDINNASYFFTQYPIDSNYKLSICAMSNRFPNNIVRKCIDNIIQDIK